MLSLKPLIGFVQHGASFGVSAVLHAAVLGAVYYSGTQTYMNEPQQVVVVSIENSISQNQVAAIKSHEAVADDEKNKQHKTPILETQPALDLKTPPKAPHKKQQKNITASVPHVQTQPVENAVVLNNTPPIYPESARNMGAQGRVVVLVHITELGHVTSVKIINSSGHISLDNAAKNTVQGWKFLPARKGDLKIASQLKIPINFQLN